MRWSYILPRIIFVIIIWAFFYFAFDPILRWSIIKGLENILEAKVEIDKVKTSFIHPSFEIYNLKAGNSKEEFKNLFEFKLLKLKIDGKQLFEKKFIMEEGSLSGLQFNTQRKTSCKIYIPKTEMPEFIKEMMQKGQDLALDRISDIKSDFSKDIKIEMDNLQSLKLIEELQNKYENEYKDLIKKADFSVYDDSIKKINEEYEKIKKEKDFLKKAKEITKLKKDIDKLLKNFKEDTDNIKKLTLEAKDLYKEIDEAKKNDIDKVISLAKIPSVDKEKIANILLGPEIINKIEKYWGISKTAIKYIPENPRKKVFEEKRKRGRIIHFIKENNYPKFLIKKLHIDGVLSPENPIEYSGSILNITNQPALYPKPLTIEISGKRDNSLLELKGMAYLYKEPLESEFYLRYDGLPISGIKLGNEKTLKIDINKAVSYNTLKLKTISNELNGSFISNFKNVQMQPYANVSYKPLKESIENAISRINYFNINVLIKGKFSKPEFKIDTDLANIVNDTFKKVFGQQLDIAKKQVQEKIDLAIKEQKEKLDKILKDKKSELDSKIKANQEKIDNCQKSIEENIKKSTTKNIPKLKF